MDTSRMIRGGSAETLPTVLIVGGTQEGVLAALDLARWGAQVILIDSEDFVGCVGSLPPHAQNARLLEAYRHPNLTVLTRAELLALERAEGAFRVRLREAPRYVDLAKCTACGDCAEVCPVTVPGTDHKVIHVGAPGTQPQIFAIDKVGQPPCANACPGGIHVQGYVALTAQGRFREALALVREAIPFAAVCGRVCTHPCQANCRRAELEGDSAVSVRALKRFLADWERYHPEEFTPPPSPSPPTGKRVAVIGSGPVGLTVAAELAQKGHAVEVFEALPVAGGLLVLGIPAYRLPRDVLAQEIGRIEQMGVEIHVDSPVGPQGTVMLEELAQTFDALFVGVGAHKSRQLRVPGEELDGVVQGLDLLRAVNLAQVVDPEQDPRWQAALETWLPPDRKTRAVVVGGGNTAMDVARSLWRLGADVEVLYRRTRAEMPAIPHEVEDLEAEGIPLRFLTNPSRVLGQDGRVTGVECLRMALGEPDESGRRRPIPIEGSEFVIEADLVVPAIGQMPNLDFLGKLRGDFDTTRWDTFDVVSSSYMTSRPGVFAGGDAVSGPATVIEAIGDARKAAAAVDAYLRGASPEDIDVAEREEVVVSHREMAPEELTYVPAVPLETLPVTERRGNFFEVEEIYSPEQAMAEAARCLVCGPCSECMACEQVCEAGAIDYDAQEIWHDLAPGAVIVAAEGLPGTVEATELGAHRLRSGEPVASVVARVMAELAPCRLPEILSLPEANPVADDLRLGVFVCRCGDEIAGVVNVASVVEAAARLPGVVHAESLSFSCGPEGKESIESALARHHLDAALLAACSCCDLDQVCYSCTFQRLRTRLNLEALDALGSRLDFVNIREQCAWAHRDDPALATAKAAQMVEAGVTHLRRSADRPRTLVAVDKPVLVVGDGAAADASLRSMLAAGLQAVRSADEVVGLRGSLGRFTVTLRRNGSMREVAVSSVVAFPPPVSEDDRWAEWRKRPGVVVGDLTGDAEVAGASAAARVGALLGSGYLRSDLNVAQVDPLRCRACGDCEALCEAGAIAVQTGADGQRYACVDVVACLGCGLCAAHCPSGALTAGYSSDRQLEAMLEAVLA